MPLPLSDGAGLGCRQGMTPRPASAGLGHKASPGLRSGVQPSRGGGRGQGQQVDRSRGIQSEEARAPHSQRMSPVLGS